MVEEAVCSLVIGHLLMIGCPNPASFASEREVGPSVNQHWSESHSCCSPWMTVTIAINSMSRACCGTGWGHPIAGLSTGSLLVVGWGGLWRRACRRSFCRHRLQWHRKFAVAHPKVRWSNLISTRSAWQSASTQSLCCQIGTGLTHFGKSFFFLERIYWKIKKF